MDGATNTTVTVTDPLASLPTYVAVNPTTNMIYVGNVDSNNVTVINGATNMVVATVPVGGAVGATPRGLVVNPVTNTIYALSYEDSSFATSSYVTVINGAANTTTTVPTPLNGSDIQVNTLTNTVYIANDSSPGSVTVLNGATNATTSISDPKASYPFRLAVDQTTDVIYALNASNNISVINGAPASAFPPSCQLTGIVAGPPEQIQITMQDTGSGLASIQATESVNASVSIPGFSTGTTSPVVVTATKLNQSQGSEVGFTVTNVAGLSTSCDPADFKLSLDGSTESHVFTNLTSAEQYVRVIDGDPGLKSLTLIVNGSSFQVGLKYGETRVFNIGAAMLSAASVATRRGAANRGNTVEVYATGSAGDSATILVGDSSIIDGAPVTSVGPLL
jgi:YVTN family beta-propeller protein